MDGHKYGQVERSKLWEQYKSTSLMVISLSYHYPQIVFFVPPHVLTLQAKILTQSHPQCFYNIELA